MRFALFSLIVLLAGCDAIRSTSDRWFGGAEPQPAPEPVVAEVEPEEPPATATQAGWVGARTTIAGLGDPNTPGRWLETPLVEAEINGRIVVPKTGAQAYVTLVPASGPAGGGSRLSLEAMRALLLPFDELVELDVYSD
ncbi:hypothetical protein [Ruegeria sp.]|uniref:hypothetical protein n=1 Tax=Ruegeria sp. TaxID=1879320 RepID=UPI00230B3D5F|nr:hypothetical protein [Ruegeria sp.]MDA7963094.1 hypothetical protein [Ruegeria sp.]